MLTTVSLVHGGNTECIHNLAKCLEMLNKGIWFSFSESVMYSKEMSPPPFSDAALLLH